MRTTHPKPTALVFVGLVLSLTITTGCATSYLLGYDESEAMYDAMEKEPLLLPLVPVVGVADMAVGMPLSFLMIVAENPGLAAKAAAKATEPGPDPDEVVAPSPASSSSPHSSADSPRSFARQDIQDFFVDAEGGRVQVCVWDHECEDGDRLRISLAGEVFEVKLKNVHQCESFILSEGDHELEILAVNGTGYEGDCSYHDENTGTVKVHGSGSSYSVQQTWRVQGGAGTSATMTVRVP